MCLLRLSSPRLIVRFFQGDITIFEECVKELATKSVHKIEHFLLVRATNAHFSKFFSDATIRLVIVNRNNPGKILKPNFATIISDIIVYFRIFI